MCGILMLSRHDTRGMIVDGTPCRARVPRQQTIFGGVFCSEAAMIRTYRYRLYPTKTQERTLDFMLWQGRTLYNATLEQLISVYNETGKGVSYYQQWAYFRDLRNANPDTLGQLNATSVQQMLRDRKSTRLNSSHVKISYAV